MVTIVRTFLKNNKNEGKISIIINKIDAGTRVENNNGIKQKHQRDITAYKNLILDKGNIFKINV